MMMDVKTPVKPGDEVSVTLTLADGEKVEFTAVGKDFAGGNESYQPQMPGMSQPQHEHGRLNGCRSRCPGDAC